MRSTTDNEHLTVGWCSWRNALGVAHMRPFICCVFLASLWSGCTAVKATVMMANAQQALNEARERLAERVKPILGWAQTLVTGS